MRNIAQLAKDGFARQILVSLEPMACYHISERDLTEDQRWRLNSPKRQYTYPIDDFIPQLLKAGVKESDVHAMTTENPRRFFAGEKI